MPGGSRRIITFNVSVKTNSPNISNGKSNSERKTQNAVHQGNNNGISSSNQAAGPPHQSTSSSSSSCYIKKRNPQHLIFRSFSTNVPYHNRSSTSRCKRSASSRASGVTAKEVRLNQDIYEENEIDDDDNGIRSKEINHKDHNDNHQNHVRFSDDNGVGDFKRASFKNSKLRHQRSMMGAGGGRHDHCYTEVHIPPTPHMGVGSLTSSHNTHYLSGNPEENDRNNKFTITLKPGQYRVNVQWKSKTQPFRITLTPRQKSLTPDGPPPLEQQPLFYSTQAPAPPPPPPLHPPPSQPSASSAQQTSTTQTATIASFPRRLVHRLLYKPNSSSSGQQCFHHAPSHNPSLTGQVINPTTHPRANIQEHQSSVINKERTTQSANLPNGILHSPSYCNRKGQKRGWDGGPKHRNRKNRYRWGSLSCVHINSLDESLGETSGGDSFGGDSFGGYEGVEHLKRHSFSHRRHSLNQQALLRARQAHSSVGDKSFIQKCSRSILWNRFKQTNAGSSNTKANCNFNTGSNYESLTKAKCISGDGNLINGGGNNKNASSSNTKGGGVNVNENFSSKVKSNFKILQHKQASPVIIKNIPKDCQTISDSHSDEGTDNSSFIFVGKPQLISQSVSCSALPHGCNKAISNNDNNCYCKNGKDLSVIPERKTWHEDEAFVKQIVDEYFKDPPPLSDNDEHNANSKNKTLPNVFANDCDNDSLPDLIGEVKKRRVCDDFSYSTDFRYQGFSKNMFNEHPKVYTVPENQNSLFLTSSHSSSSYSSTISSTCSESSSNSYVLQNLLSPLTEAAACISVDDTYCDSDDSTSWFTDDSLGYEADEEPSDRETSGLLFWRQWRSAPDVSLKKSQYVNPENNLVSVKNEASKGNDPTKQNIICIKREIKTPYATRKSCSTGDTTKLSSIKINLQKIKTHTLQQFCEETLFGFSKTKKGKTKSIKKDRSLNRYVDNSEQELSIKNSSNNIKEKLEFVNAKFRPGIDKNWCPQILKDFMASMAKFTEGLSNDDSATEKTENILSRGLVVTRSNLTSSTARLVQTIPSTRYSVGSGSDYCSTLSSDRSYFNDGSTTPEMMHCEYKPNNSSLAMHSNTNSLLKNCVFYNSKLSGSKGYLSSDQDISLQSNESYLMDSSDAEWSHFYSSPVIESQCFTKNDKKEKIKDDLSLSKKLNYEIVNSNFKEKQQKSNDRYNQFENLPKNANNDRHYNHQEFKSSVQKPSSHMTQSSMSFKRSTVNSWAKNTHVPHGYVSKSSTPSDEHLLSSESPSRCDNIPHCQYSPFPRSSEDSACPRSPNYTEPCRFDPSPEYYRTSKHKDKSQPHSLYCQSGHPYICKVNSPHNVHPAEDKAYPTSSLSVCQDEAGARSKDYCGTIRDTCVKNECDTAIVNSSPDKDMAKVNIKINLSHGVNKNSDNVDLQIPSTYAVPVDNIESGDSNYGYKTYENIPPTWSAKLHRTCYSMRDVPVGEVCFAHRSSSSDQGIEDGTPTSGLGHEINPSNDESSSNERYKKPNWYKSSTKYNESEPNLPNNPSNYLFKQAKSTGVRSSAGLVSARPYTSSDNSDTLSKKSTKNINLSFDNSNSNSIKDFNVQRIQVGTAGQKKYVQSNQKSVLEIPVTSVKNTKLSQPISNFKNVKSEVIVNPNTGTKVKQTTCTSLKRSIIPPNEKCISEYKIGDTSFCDKSDTSLLANDFKVSYNSSVDNNKDKSTSIINNDVNELCKNVCNDNVINKQKVYKNSSKNKYKSKPRKYFSGILDALSGRASTPESKNPENPKRMPRSNNHKYCSSTKTQLGDSTGENTNTEDSNTSNSVYLSHYIVTDDNRNTSPRNVHHKDNLYKSISSISEQSLSEYNLDKSYVNETNTGGSHPHLQQIRPNNSSVSPVKGAKSPSTKEDTPPTLSFSSEINVTPASINIIANTNDNNNNNGNNSTTTCAVPVTSSYEDVEATYNIPLDSLSRKTNSDTTSYIVYSSNDSSDNASCSFYENMVFHRSHSFVKQPAETVSYTINLSSANDSSSGSSSVSSGTNLNTQSGNSSCCSNSSTSSSKDVNITDNLRPISTLSSVNNSPGNLDSSPSIFENSQSSHADSSPFSPLLQDSLSFHSTNSSPSNCTNSNSLVDEEKESSHSSSSSDSQFLHTNTKVEPTEQQSQPESLDSSNIIINDDSTLFVDDDEDVDDDDDSDFSSERLSFCRSASSASLASNASSFYYTAGASTVYDAIKSVTEYLSVADDIPDPPKECIVVDRSRNVTSSHESRKSKHRNDRMKSRRSDIEDLNKGLPIASSDTDCSTTDGNQYVNANVSVVNDKIVVTVNPEIKRSVSATEDKDAAFVKAAKQYSLNKSSSYESTNKLSKARENVDFRSFFNQKDDPKIEERLPPIGASRKRDKFSPFREYRQESPILSRKIDIDMPPLVTMRNKSASLIDTSESTKNPSDKLKDEGKPPSGDSRRGRFIGRRRSTESAGARLSAHTIPSMVVTDSDNKSNVASSNEFANLPPKPPPSPHSTENRSSGVYHNTTFYSNIDADKSNVSGHDYYNFYVPDHGKYPTEHLYENVKRNYDIRRTRSEEKVRDRNSFGLYSRDSDISDDELDDKRASGLWATAGRDADIESLSEDNEALHDGLSREFLQAQKGSNSFCIDANNQEWHSTTSLNSQASSTSTKGIDDDLELFTQDQDLGFGNLNDSWEHQNDHWRSRCSMWDHSQHLQHSCQHHNLPQYDYLQPEVVDHPWGYPQRSYSGTELPSPNDEWNSGIVGGSSPYHQHSPSPDHFLGCSGPGQSPSRGKPPRSPSHRGRDPSSVPREGGCSGKPSPRPRSTSRKRSRSASCAAKYRVELEVPVRSRQRPASLASLSSPSKGVFHPHNLASQESLYDTRPAPLRLSPVNDVAPDPSWYVVSGD